MAFARQLGADSPTMRSSISIPGPRAPFSTRRRGRTARSRKCSTSSDCTRCRRRRARAACTSCCRCRRGVPNDGARMLAELVATTGRGASSEDRDDRAVGEVARTAARSTSTFCRTFAERPWPVSIPCARNRRRPSRRRWRGARSRNDLDPTEFTIDTRAEHVRERRRSLGQGNEDARTNSIS